MEQLDFKLPDFTRISWVGETTRTVWQPRIERVRVAWHALEWLSVLAGIRTCAVSVLSPEQLMTEAGEWAKHGLSVLPVAMQGVSQYTYANKPVQPEAGQPFSFRCVLGLPQDVSRFKEAWDADDHRAIGKLLGYPECCTEFFYEVWVTHRMMDTTWPMAGGLHTAATNGHCLQAIGYVEANILWRWAGVRAAPHLPCSFQCEATRSLGQQLIALGREAGYAAEMDWLLEALSWPVEWSALHGIAEIKTPLFKISTNTDATSEKYVVQWPGSAYPAEGAAGVCFPYRPYAHPRPPHTDTLRQEPASMSTWYAQDNGFPSRAVMDEAHHPLVALARVTLAGQGGAVLDLGCGNAVLLSKLYADNAALIPFGVDNVAAHIAHAREVLPDFAANLVEDDLFAADMLWPPDRRYALVILMPGRFLEVDAARAASLKARLQQHVERILVYAYGDWLTRYGNLQGLAQAAGLTLGDSDAAAPAALAYFPSP